MALLCDLVRLQRAKLDPVLVNMVTSISVHRGIGNTPPVILRPRDSLGRRCCRLTKLTVYAVTVNRRRGEHRRELDKFVSR
jgi:hypothetical protein